MGMYTELVCAFKLKKDTPEEVINTIAEMCEHDQNYNASNTPNHELFKTHRWRVMLRSDSYYFDGDTNSTIRHDRLVNSWFVTIRCNLKNYDNEIEKFIDWVKPYIHKDNDNDYFIGYKRYEEDYHPDFIFV